MNLQTREISLDAGPVNIALGLVALRRYSVELSNESATDEDARLVVAGRAVPDPLPAAHHSLPKGAPGEIMMPDQRTLESGYGVWVWLPPGERGVLAVTPAPPNNPEIENWR